MSSSGRSPCGSGSRYFSAGDSHGLVEITSWADRTTGLYFSRRTVIHSDGAVEGRGGVESACLYHRAVLVKHPAIEALLGERVWKLTNGGDQRQRAWWMGQR